MNARHLRPRTVADLPAPWDTDPFVVNDFHRWPEAEAWGDERALLVSSAPRPGVRSVVGVGAPEPLADLVTDLPDDEEPLAVMSLTRGAWDLLPGAVTERLALPSVAHWDWLWSADQPPRVPREDGVVELHLARDHEEIADLQSRVLPGTYFPVDREGARWFGWRDQDLALRSVAGASGWDRWVHLGSIGTEEAWRGRGLGAAVTAAVTRLGLCATGRVSLGVYADNARAQALYTRLGFAVGQHVESRRRA